MIPPSTLPPGFYESRASLADRFGTTAEAVRDAASAVGVGFGTERIRAAVFFTEQDAQKIFNHLTKKTNTP